MSAPVPATSHHLSRLRGLKWAAIVEGATLLALLGVAVPLKHLAHQPAAVSIMGPAHGLAVLFYLWQIAMIVPSGRWSGREIGRLLLGALLPLGACFSLALIARKAAA